MVEASKEVLFIAMMECDMVSPTEGETNLNYEIAPGSGVMRGKVHSHTRTEGVTRVQRSKGSHGKFLVTKNISSVEGRTMMWKTSSAQQAPQASGRLKRSGRRLFLPGR